MLDQALYAVSLVTFTFGTLVFSVLAVMYWPQRRRAPVLGAFTLVLAISFVLNLASQIFSSQALSVGLSIVTSLLPALIFHLCAPTRTWRWLVIAFYPVSLIMRWSIPAAALGIGAVLGLAALIVSQHEPDRRKRHYRLWIMAILAGLVCVSAIQVTSYPGPFFSVLPDYLVLMLFCVTLYYRERLVFLDLVIKRGAMFLVALTVLTICTSVWFRLAGAQMDWLRIWAGALALSPLWMAAPWVYRRLETFVDRVWLGRRYSVEEGEQKFAHDVQSSSSERELCERAAASASEIFGSTAEVADGSIRVAALRDGAPLLSDDHRLLGTLNRALAVVLENVRFREREQHLRLLASRAELKALRAQINPHFLFNALNAIAGLIQTDPRLADETIERLARVFRYALSKSEREWVRLDEEMEFVKAYLGVEQARFGKRLRVEIWVDDRAAAVPIPAVCIQPLIENAIKHGVSLMESLGVVGVRADVLDGKLRVEVFDNGPGFPKNFSMGETGHGLRNVSDRLSGYYGPTARLYWSNGREGNRVCVEVPVNGDARSDRG
jgi:hypothetical protein